jgi:glyoxylase-like metal-dependent hydrolase (beta-lactamase superfamily II)
MVAAMAQPTVRRVESSVGGTPVNAYLVEGEDGTVAVDATLTVSGGRALRGALRRPLAGVVVTHAHPDHYGGLAELVAGEDVPVYATDGVTAAIRRDDDAKEQILRPMFGDEWPAERRFPDRTVSDGETVELAGVRLTVRDLGPGESPHDSIWLLDGGDAVFAGDQAYNHAHCYLADGYWEQWLEHIARLEDELDPGATLHVGHGDPATLELLAWQRGYIETFVEAIRSDDDVVAAMTRYLPSDRLRFLMELSVAPMTERLARA